MEILFKSLVSGVVVAVVLAATKLLGPRFGGVLAGIPLVFTLSFVFATHHAESRMNVEKFLFGGMWSAALLGVFVVALWFFYSHTNTGYWRSVLCAYGVWVLLFCLYFNFFPKGQP